jgi:hypothetical protein
MGRETPAAFEKAPEEYISKCLLICQVVGQRLQNALQSAFNGQVQWPFSPT